MDNTVTLTLEKYNELHRKSLVYDQKKKELELELMEGGYVSNDERAMFGLPSKEESNRAALEKIRERLEKELAEVE